MTASGQLVGIDPYLLEDMLIAPLWYRLLITGQPITWLRARSRSWAVVQLFSVALGESVGVRRWRTTSSGLTGGSA